ncbi:high affinity cationic amino acid transporter 1-like isoform X2 [Xenia sp. Carnegie-2017]|uniref:high affinity cationic amino acid transporter 1-like isoform X2 n=1 Tax=Xenia sp. Carnegie-2017 TaxID=2897299 RepID=UPI001F033EF7|nr:high affinity cationic amino acid transporter 1-like isoform X2 [Xenia sp. Carnegie-2017]
MTTKIIKAFQRTKTFTTSEVEETQLKRCLSTLDLTALGIGCTLGAGVYVLVGQIARNEAGPAIVVSFAIAAVASLLSGLCYAEFGAQVPKSGSAYIYSYVTVGELIAFVVGWNMLLEYIMAGAAVAKAWSDFFNSLCHNCVKNLLIEHIGAFKVHWLSEYPDFLAFAVIAVSVTIVICGVSESTTFNLVLTILNLAVIAFVTFVGLTFADTGNWSDFAPWGFHGIMSGASTCFFAFVGFDVIATSGEEAKNPHKAIPRATVAALFVIFLAYESVSVTLTLMLPYHSLPETSALATAFEIRGFSTGKYVVAVGAICGLSASVLDALFAIPRIMYSMASDRLIFSCFAKVNDRTGTPLIACLSSGLLTALLAMFFDLASLAEMLSVGTLLSYTIVAISVILLRYRPGNIIKEETADPGEMLIDDDIETLGGGEVPEKEISSSKNFNETLPILTRLGQCIMGRRLDEPNEDSYLVVKVSLIIFLLSVIGLESCLIWGMDYLRSKNPYVIIIFVLFVTWMLLAVDVISRQPERKASLYFKVPFLPHLPLAAVFINVFLLLELRSLTWIRFAVWMTIGMVIYLSYGIRYSKQNEEN